MRELHPREHRSKARHSAASWPVLVAIALAGAGCLRTVEGGQDDLVSGLAPADDAGVLVDDVNGQGNDLDPPAITLESTQPESGPRVVLEAEVVGDGVVVRVTLDSFKKLVGIASHLRYDPKGLKLTKVAEHKVLQSKGFSSRTVVRESPSGRVLMGAARFRIETRPWDPPEGTAVGHQLWATLYFDVLTPGSHRIHFDPTGTLVKDANYADVKTSWGELTIHRAQEAQ